MIAVNNSARRATVAAAVKADRHLSSAVRNLCGYRLPLSGTCVDVETARLELRAAFGNIAEALLHLDMERSTGALSVDDLIANES